MDYREYNDSELILYVNENNEEAYNILFKKYEPLINKIANKMYPIAKNGGLEFDDLVSEGMTGLAAAIETFSDNKGASFYTYAKTIIERKIINAVTKSKRQKHQILNESSSFEIEVDGAPLVLDSFLKDNTFNPEIIFMENIDENDLVSRIKKDLTNIELEVFELKINGFSYKEIAEILEKTPKSIDNTLQRIRNKVKEMTKNANNEL